MKKLLLLFLGSAIFLSGCVRVPQDLMRPSAESLKIRAAQSHTFNVNSDKLLLQASMAVLQDMGYTIKESSLEYGVLTAIKEASATSKGQIAAAVALAVLCGEQMPIDKTQYISVTMVILGKSECGQAIARTTFQRLIVRTDNTRYTQTVTDPNVYREFYEKLDKSLFLEVNNL